MHAIWGLGIVGHDRGAPAVATAIAQALGDPDADVRRVAALVLGDLHAQGFDRRPLLALLGDPAARVRFAAAQALGSLGVTAAIEPLVTALAANDDDDPELRFAYARALGRIAPPAQLAGLEQHASRAVRLGAVLALREAGSESVGEFLADPDPQVATEAARATVDLALPRAMAALTSTLPGLRADLRITPYVSRALHAALRLGGAAQAEQVAAFAADSLTEADARREALAVLGQWEQPGPEGGVVARGGPLAARAGVSAR